MFTDWLVKAYYLRLFLQLSKIPHYTTLQKFTDRINIMERKDNLIFYPLYRYKTHIYGYRFDWIQNNTCIRVYTSSIAKLRMKKYAKLSIGADVLKQIICNIKVRRDPT